MTLEILHNLKKMKEEDTSDDVCEYCGETEDKHLSNGDCIAGIFVGIKTKFKPKRK